MSATRSLLEVTRRQCVRYLAEWRPGLPDGRASVLEELELLAAALAEIEAAEVGCGSTEPGSCTCLCHAGIVPADHHG